MLMSIYWDFDPVMLRLGESFDVRYYGLMWALAIGLAAVMFDRFVKREGLPEKVSESIFYFGTLATIIGSRVGHCLFYEPDKYLAEPLRMLTDIRDGGMASHGATIGIIFGIWMCVRRNHLPFVWGLDRIAIVAPLSGAIIRLGNLFNSEIVGYPTDSAFGFKFVYHDARRAWYEFAGDVPQEVIDAIPARHPAQLYEALCYFLTFGVLMWLYSRKDLGRRRPGFLFGVAMIGIFLTRFFIEFLKERQVDFEMGMALDMGQLLSLPFILLGLFMIARAMLRPAVADIDAVVAHANKEYAREDKKRDKGKKR